MTMYNEITDDTVKDAVSTLRALFPPKVMYNELVLNGAAGDESHTIDGDDLATACYSLEIIYYWILHEKNISDD